MPFPIATLTLSVEEYFSGSPASLTRSLSPNAVHVDVDTGSRSYHLVKPLDADGHKDCERSNKMVSEVYLTRLLSTKVALVVCVELVYYLLLGHWGMAF